VNYDKMGRMIFDGDGWSFKGRHHRDEYADLPESFRPHHGEGRRTRYSHPYSYDPFICCGSNGPTNEGCYSDRLFSWDRKKAEACAERHLNGVSEYGDLKKVQEFLRDFFDEPKLKLVYVLQMCNVSSGCPVWYFGYNTPKGIAE